MDAIISKNKYRQQCLIKMTLLFSVMLVIWGHYADVKFLGDQVSQKKATQQQIQQMLQQQNFSGVVLIVKDNQILWQQAYGKDNKLSQQNNQLTTYFQIASAQKALTAVLIARLVEQRQLSWSDKLSQFYPQIRGSQKITLLQMLQMKSGLVLTSKPKKINQTQQWLNYCLQNVTATKQKTCQYQPVNYTLLAGIAMQQTKRDYKTLIQEFVLSPLKLKNTGFYSDLKDHKRQAKSYLMTNKTDDLIPVQQSKTSILTELGTGNMSMTVHDFWHFFEAILKGDLLNATTRQVIWPLDSSYLKYSGGTYSQLNLLKAQGQIAGFESALIINPISKKSVVLLSNVMPLKGRYLDNRILRDRLYKLISIN